MKTQINNVQKLQTCVELKHAQTRFPILVQLIVQLIYLLVDSMELTALQRHAQTQLQILVLLTALLIFQHAHLMEHHVQLQPLVPHTI